MIKKRFCNSCGSEIIFDFVRPNLSFKIENNKIVRDPSRDPFLKYGEITGVEFICSKDINHDIFPKDASQYDSFDEWMEKVTEEIFRIKDEFDE